MRENMLVRVICSIISVTALIGAMFFSYCIDNGFFVNISLAVFGSALITYTNAFISYKVKRREAIMLYLTDLRRYRYKLKSLTVAPDSSKIADITDFFYQLTNDYNSIQHLRKQSSINKKLKTTLNCSFENVLYIQKVIDNGKYGVNINDIINRADQAANEVEELAKEMKYLDKKGKEMQWIN